MTYFVQILKVNTFLSCYLFLFFRITIMFNIHLRYSTTSRNLSSHYLHISSFTFISIYGLIILNFCFTGLPPGINKSLYTTIFVSTSNMLAKNEATTSIFFNNLIKLFFSATKFRVLIFSSFLFLFVPILTCSNFS